jgi:mono/diheme cytochrome c family protein
MRTFHAVASFSLLVCGAILSITLEAQLAPQASPGVPQTDQERRGEALFINNCTLCHVFTEQKLSIGIQARTELIGLGKRPGTDDAALRKAILQGIPGRKPNFQYILTPQEVDEMVAYLKIR